MLAVFAPLAGALITFMNNVNSGLAGRVGTLVACLVIHLAGLATVSILILALRGARRGEPARPGALKPWLYAGGVVGVGTVYSSAFAFSSLGASLAVALALLGQTFFSVAADATGFLGREKRPLSARRLPGICLALAGAAIMVRDLRGNAPAILAGLAAGLLPGFSTLVNAELGRAKGLLRSARINYLGGLAATLALVALVRPDLAEGARGTIAAGPLLALGGGVTGLATVVSMNFIFARMSAFSATLLVFGGEILAGVAIDAAVAGSFDPRKLAGAAALLAGFAADALLARRARRSDA